MPEKSKTYEKKSPRVYIRTFGCQMNKRDTEILKNVLSCGDFVFTDKEDKANIILYNTCSVRKHAEDRVIGKMGQLSKKKLTQPSTIQYPILGIIGCMASIHKDKLFEKIPGLDLICSPSNIYNLKDDLEEIINKNKKIKDIKQKDFLEDKYKYHEIRESQVCAWVSIMEGCENFCSYCVVPFARGKEVSRPLAEIIDEINKLTEKGFKEITLLGQNVNSYNEKLENINQKKNSFIRLLEKINNETEIKRIRFTTSHPKDTSIELFKAMRDLDKVCPHLHMPLQSGSDRILKLMNRGYTYKKFKKLVDNLKSIYPECSLTTDIIVGFPSELNQDFMKTYNAMKEIQFDSAFIFKYSPRPKTAASKLKDDISLEEKKQRNQKLLKLQDEISLEKNKKYTNKYVKVLTETETKKRIYLDTDIVYDKKYIARIPDNRLVLFKGKKGLIGEEVKVKILNVTAHSLVGRQMTES